MAKVKVAFKNVLDKRATYKEIENEYVALAVLEYARVYCTDPELYQKVMRERVNVRLNGKLIAVDDWYTTPLRDGDKILVMPVLEGDFLKGGFFQIILGAILIAAAVYTGGGSLSLFAGLAIKGSTLFLMGSAFILGGLASILMEPDLPTISSGGLSGKGSTTYNWNGISTQSRTDQPLPIVYGKHVVGGNLINIFTERQGEDDYLYMLIALCEGPIQGICTEDNSDSICTTSDQSNAAYKHPAITLDDQPLKNYTDLEWWYRTGTNLPDATLDPKNPTAQNIVPYFSGSRMQIDVGDDLTTDGVVYTTSKEVDMAVVQVNFPALFDANGGGVNPTTVEYKIEYKKNGTATWYPFTQTRFDTTVTAQTKADGTVSPLKGWNANLRFNPDQGGAQDDGVYLLTDQKPDSYWVEVTSQVVKTNTQSLIDNFYGTYAPEGSKRIVYTLTIKNITTGEMTTQKIAYLVPIKTITEQSWGVTYVVGEQFVYSRAQATINEIVIGPYVAQPPQYMRVGDRFLLSATASQQTWIPIKTKSKTGFWDTKILDFNSLADASGRQIYDIRVSRRNPQSTNFQVSDKIILNSIIEVVNGDFIYPNTALVGFRIKATGQLSGSPPNMNVLIKGKKVLVPSLSGTEAFDAVFWNDSTSRWEADGAERTWDNVTYEEEYSNNPMLCLKDLMTNKRYGLGEYTNDGDFNSANIISIIKACHIEYTPTVEDFVRWWTAGNTGDFAKNIEDGKITSFPDTLTINTGARSIAYSGGFSHWIPFRLDAPLKAGQSYQFSITLSGTAHNVDIDLAVMKGNWSRSPYNTWYQIGDYTAPEISDAGDGTHTYTFTAPFEGIIGMVINLRKTGKAQNTSGTITDISVDSVTGTGAARAWHYHTFNGVFDTKQAALAALMEFANAFRVWPAWYEGTFKFIMDKDETPIHTLSLSNTISFSQSWTPLSEIPYRMIGQFTDEDHKYDMTQIMTHTTDTTVPKSNEQTIGLKGITNRKRAERELKFRLTKFTNQTHTINIRCGLDMIHATAGDIINVSNDLPQWGHGSRIASYDAVTQYVYLTEPYTISDATPADLVIKYQDANNSFQTASIDVASITDGDTVRRLHLKTWPGNPAIGGVAAMGISTTYIKPFRLISVTRNAEDEVEANAVEHITTIYSSEPTLVVDQSFETKSLDLTIGKPGKPINLSFNPLLPTEGIGWDIHAEHADLRSQEIIVEFGEGANPSSYTQVGAILQGENSIRYINPYLKTGSYHVFRLFAKGITGRSGSTYQTVFLDKQTFDVPPVTGLQIKGSNPLSQTWDGLNVTFQWNPVGQDLYRTGLIDFYTIYIYHTSYDPTAPNTNLLRTAQTKKTEYQYTYDMNVEDNGSATSVKGTLIFVVTANLVNGIESQRSRPFLVGNAVPNTPQNFTSDVALRTINFKWSPVTDTDFKTFRLRSKLSDSIGSLIGSWSSWEDKTSNNFSRNVNGTEIGTYGNRVRVFLEVKTVDIYNGSSAVASGNNITESLGVTIGTQTIASWMLADNAIVNIKIEASAIDSRTVATGAIVSDAIVAGAILTDKLAASSVATNKIQTNAILAAKIAANAVIADKIAANSVSAAKINVATLSAIAANMGVLTAGVAKSADGRLFIDFDNKFIKIFDAASALRVQLGSIS